VQENTPTRGRLDFWIHVISIMKKGLIFDIDGVLVDPMPFHSEAMGLAIKEERTN
jgi:hypothetical protein